MSMTNRDQHILALAAERTTDHAAQVTTLHAPAVAETLGRALSAQLRPYSPGIVVVWGHVDTALLGHVVGRELTATVVHAYADEGVLSLSTSLRAHERVAPIDYDWSDRPGLDALIGLIHTQGGDVVVSGSVLPATHETTPVVTVAPEHSPPQQEKEQS